MYFEKQNFVSFFSFIFLFYYFDFCFDRLWPAKNPAKARYHKVPTRHTRHEFPVQKSSLWWRRFIGALTLTGQSFCSVPCLSCASGSQLCGGILWVGSLLPVRRVCLLLPVLLLPGPQKRSCNSVLCSSNTPPWSAARTQPAVQYATSFSSAARHWWSTWSTPTRTRTPPELPVSIEKSRTERPSRPVVYVSLFFPARVCFLVLPFVRASTNLREP